MPRLLARLYREYISFLLGSVRPIAIDVCQSLEDVQRMPEVCMGADVSRSMRLKRLSVRKSIRIRVCHVSLLNVTHSDK
jgi:hypothetical protein